MDLGIGSKSDFVDNPERYLCSSYKPHRDIGLIGYAVQDRKPDSNYEDITIGSVAWLSTVSVLWKIAPEAFVAMTSWKKRWAIWLSVNYFLVSYSPSSRTGEIIQGEKGWLKSWRKACSGEFLFKIGG